VRHVRMLGLCLIALFAIGGVVAAVPAMALTEETENEPPQKRLKKDFSVFNHCPVASEPAHIGTCIFAETAGGKEGGEYTVGSITVPINKTIILQGGEKEVASLKSRQEAEEDYPGEPHPGFSSTGEYFRDEGVGIWHGPTDGSETLEAPPLKVPGGFANRISPQPYWPQALTEKFEAAKKNKELTATETVELAGRPWISRSNLILEAPESENEESPGTAYHLPMKITVNSPFLADLDSGPCHVGSSEHPVIVELTSGTSTGPFPYEYNTSHGGVPVFFIADYANYVKVPNSTLVNNTFAVTTGAEGCGGEYESYVDRAISKAAGVPSPAGANSVILKGTLQNSNSGITKCILEEYNEVETKAWCEELYGSEL
jgi:hypothetical protein